MVLSSLPYPIKQEANLSPEFGKEKMVPLHGRFTLNTIPDIIKLNTSRFGRQGDREQSLRTGQIEHIAERSLQRTDPLYISYPKPLHPRWLQILQI